MIVSFNDFLHKYNLKNEATSNKKSQNILSFWYLKDVGTYLKDGTIEKDVGILTLHPPKGTHWVVYINEKIFDSYGCSAPQTLSKIIIKRSRYSLIFE